MHIAVAWQFTVGQSDLRCARFVEVLHLWHQQYKVQNLLFTLLKNAYIIVLSMFKVHPWCMQMYADARELQVTRNVKFALSLVSPYYMYNAIDLLMTYFVYPFMYHYS